MGWKCRPRSCGIWLPRRASPGPCSSTNSTGNAPPMPAPWPNCRMHSGRESLRYTYRSARNTICPDWFVSSPNVPTHIPAGTPLPPPPDPPAALASTVQETHTALVESVVETDDELMEKYFEGEEPSREQMVEGIHQGMLDREG